MLKSVDVLHLFLPLALVQLGLLLSWLLLKMILLGVMMVMISTANSSHRSSWVPGNVAITTGDVLTSSSNMRR